MNTGQYELRQLGKFTHFIFILFTTLLYTSTTPFAHHSATSHREARLRSRLELVVVDAAATLRGAARAVAAFASGKEAILLLGAFECEAAAVAPRSDLARLDARGASAAPSASSESLPLLLLSLSLSLLLLELLPEDDESSPCFRFLLSFEARRFAFFSLRRSRSFSFFLFAFSFFLRRLRSSSLCRADFRSLDPACCSALR
jgi:hypothetical protein